MWSKLIYIVFLIALLFGSVKLTHYLKSKFKLNRWIIGLSAFLVLIVPSILFNEIHPIIWNILIGIFAVLCIMFFEITRSMLENNEFKGIVKYDTDKKKK